MTSHYTWGPVTAPHGFGGELGRPLDTFFWAVTTSWSQLLQVITLQKCDAHHITKIFDLQSTEKLAVKHLMSTVRDKPEFPEGFTMDGGKKPWTWQILTAPTGDWNTVLISVYNYSIILRKFMYSDAIFPQELLLT